MWKHFCPERAKQAQHDFADDHSGNADLETINKNAFTLNTEHKVTILSTYIADNQRRRQSTWYHAR